MVSAGMELAKPPARALAPDRTGGAAEANDLQYLTFQLGNETFAIGILAIREIIEYGALTEVPMTPPFVRGVINLRGAVVPVFDLAVRFGRAPQKTSRRTCIVIVDVAAESGVEEMGIVVDAVNEVIEIPPSEIEPPPEFGARIRGDFIKGMGKVAGKFVVLLDVNRVLSVKEVAVVAAFEQQPDATASAL